MRGFLFLVFFLGSFSFVSAADILQDTYLAGETVQVYVEANSLSSGDIAVLDGNSSAVDISPLFTQYRDGLYFVYFSLPLDAEEGNYTLYVQGEEESFSVLSNDGQSVVQLKPGFIVLNKNDDTFSFQLLEKNGVGTTVVLTSSDSGVLKARKSSVTLSGSDSKDVYVDYTYGDITKDIYLNLTYGTQSYTLPVLYPDLMLEEEVVVEENGTFENVTEEEEVIEDEKEVPFVFLLTKKTVDQTLFWNQSLVGDFKIQNTVEHSVNVTYSLTGNLEDILVLNETDVSVAAGDIYAQRAWFNRENTSRAGVYSGEIVVSDGTYSDAISVNVEIVESVSSVAVVENETEEVYEPLIYGGETLVEEESNTGLYVIAGFMIFLLLVLIILVALKLRQKEDRKFNEYIEMTKKK